MWQGKYDQGHGSSLPYWKQLEPHIRIHLKAIWHFLASPAKLGFSDLTSYSQVEMLVETWLELGSNFFHEKEYMCCLNLDRLRVLNANRWNLPCGSYFWPKFWGIQGNKSAISYYWSCQLSSSAALRCPGLQSSVCRDYTEQRKGEGLFEQISWGKKHKQM